MSALDEAPTVHADDAQSWRAWLAEHHATSRGVWLVTWRARAGRSPRLAYEDAIQEALCFGWVDSTGATVDAERGKLYFAPRRPGSVWARSNRERVERLIAQGRMAPAGLAAIERARADGSWSILMSAERLEVPEDLAAALAADPAAQQAFTSFPPSTRQTLLSWVATAKRPATRASRIARIVASAARGDRDPR
jgi:uncharacterized protein YdeI (YjbR/CyaY-like superfamily)